MLDDDVVAVSPSSTYRVLKNAGRLDRRVVTPSKKGTGFIQPTKIHQEWHIDIRPCSPATKEEAERRIAKYVNYYNTVRLHSAIGYITPADCLAGLSEVIGQERDRKLEAARKLRQEKRAATKQVA
ncbi:MAG: integrase core domain-containing protein [Planctomycetota bacterium]